MGIDVLVILGVVLVTGRGQKDGVEVDCLHPKRFQVIQLVDHSLQVSSVELPEAVGGGGLIPVLHAHNRTAVIFKFAGQHIVGRVPVTEPVNKNLVHHRAARPCGRVKTGYDVPEICRPDGIADAAPGVAVTASARNDLKVIAERTYSDLKLDCIVVKKGVRVGLPHVQVALLCHEKTGLYLLPADTQPDRNLVVEVRFAWTYIVFSCIAEKCPIIGTVSSVAVRHFDLSPVSFPRREIHRRIFYTVAGSAAGCGTCFCLKISSSSLPVIFSFSIRRAAALCSTSMFSEMMVLAFA